MTDVLLGQSYFLRFDPKLWKAMQPYPPLGTLFAASALRDGGYEVAVFDAMLATDETEWQRAVESLRPRWAVLFEDNFNYLSKMCLSRMREASFRMLAAARGVGSTTLVCGSDASDNPDEYLDAGATFVIHGEGDAALVELIDWLASELGREDQGRTPLPLGIAGLSFRDDGERVRTAPRSVLRDLDALPRPAWDLIDIDRYRRLWIARHGRFSLNLATTRGCPFHCNWCAKPIWGQTYHMHSPAYVVAAMRELAESYGVDHIWFADDIMGLKRGWFAELADLLEAEGLRIPFKCLSRVDLLLRDGEVEALARAGCEVVWVGAESGSQRILDAMEKGTRVEQIEEATERLHRAGIRIGFFLQFGYPGEELDDIEATWRMMRRCEPDEIGISVSYPLPGTSFYRRVQDQLGDKRHWIDSSDLDILYEGPYGSEFYQQLARVTQLMFRRADGRRELGRVLRRPVLLRLRHVRRLAAVIAHSVSLPLARSKLLRLMGEPDERHDLVTPLPMAMSAAEAATPSAQEGRVE